MASEEHIQLSSFVKSVHHALRSEAKKLGAEAAWREHCCKEETLQEYAAAMQKLASKFWKENKSDECRIEWVVKRCLEYFSGGEMQRRRAVERNRIKKLKGNQGTPNIADECSCSDVLKLLDVGSCYNPFKVYPIFHVVPVDLAPAVPEVFRCDFLNLSVLKSKESKLLDEYLLQSCIEEMPESSFDVVVFSLLLEYLPSPEQRYRCASKAYQLLKSEGLLFIITPDSKHSSANAPIMKSWRIVLAQLGFSRLYYEKLPHIHCMAYRKAFYPEVPKHWASLARTKQSNQIYLHSHCLYIPQDFQEVLEECDSDVARARDTDEDVASMFSELPVNCE